MTAYIVAIRERIHDADELKAYGAAALEARIEGMQVLAAHGATQTLEGPAAEGVVLLQFPDMSAAKTWYESPAYQAARKRRFQGADYRFILFEGK
jgi:uncharacterized protein (DUF1330 family)